jgi:hypothetical protein
MGIDKNQAVVDYLLQCTDIHNSPVYFNLINAQDNSIQILTTAEDKAMSRQYVDGSISKRYTFNLIVFKSISDLELVKPVGTDVFPNENIDELQDVQKLIDWIAEQKELRNYPDFGEDCIVDDIDTTTEEPRYDGINTSMNPPLAMYSISVVIEYLDTSKMITK